jgi:hypothetical protein
MCNAFVHNPTEEITNKSIFTTGTLYSSHPLIQGILLTRISSKEYILWFLLAKNSIISEWLPMLSHPSDIFQDLLKMPLVEEINLP